MRSAYAEADLFDQLLLTAIASAALLGTALLYIVRADRRRAAIEPHLKALTRATPAPDGLVISLRRPQPQR
jgi:hypothetical protein